MEIFEACLTISSNCNAHTYCQNINVHGIVGLKELEITDIELYPSPTSDMIYLQSSKSFKSIQRISLTHANGQKIYEDVVQETGSTIKFSLESYPSGIYFVRLFDNKGVLTLKTIKVNGQ